MRVFSARDYILCGAGLAAVALVLLGFLANRGEETTQSFIPVETAPVRDPVPIPPGIEDPAVKATTDMMNHQLAEAKQTHEQLKVVLNQLLTQCLISVAQREVVGKGQAEIVQIPLAMRSKVAGNVIAETQLPGGCEGISTTIWLMGAVLGSTGDLPEVGTTFSYRAEEGVLAGDPPALRALIEKLQLQVERLAEQDRARREAIERATSPGKIYESSQ